MAVESERLKTAFLISFLLLLLVSAGTGCTQFKVSLGSKPVSTAAIRNASAMSVFEAAKCKDSSILSELQHQELLKLSETRILSGIDDAENRVERIADIFSRGHDRRGLAASVALPILRRAGLLVQENQSGAQKSFTQAELVKKWIVEISHRYLRSLQGHLRGQKISSEWQAFYDLATDCKASDLRILGTGINTFVTLDVPFALAFVRAHQDFENDFLKISSLLLESKKESVAMLRTQHGVSASLFFDGFFGGEGVDVLFGPAAGSRLGATLLWAEAWKHGQLLQSKATEQEAQAGIATSWAARQEILRFVRASNP